MVSKRVLRHLKRRCNRKASNRDAWRSIRTRAHAATSLIATSETDASDFHHFLVALSYRCRRFAIDLAH